MNGFKKQISKANQFMSEKIGGAKGTEFEDEFIEMEKRTDVLGKLLEELMSRTQELLQPNPASRAKMASAKAFSKIRGQSSQSLYPQVEGQLGECMIKYGREMGDDSLFGQSLVECGESYKQLAEIKYSLEDSVKQNFLEPLHQLQDKELKEVNHHRKKLTGRRLDYDCKRRKQQKGTSVPEEELRQAEEKFVESKQLASAAMHNLLENEAEQISQLSSFLEAELTYHQGSVDILQSLIESLRRKSNEAASKPRKEYVMKRTTSTRSTGSSISDHSAGYSSSYLSESKTTNNNHSSSTSSFSSATTPTAAPTAASRGGSQPSAKALYDFEPENDGELGFREGDIIHLTSRIDENWLEGEVHGRAGFFPCTYVEIVVDLPRQ